MPLRSSGRSGRRSTGARRGRAARAPRRGEGALPGRIGVGGAPHVSLQVRLRPGRPGRQRRAGRCAVEDVGGGTGLRGQDVRRVGRQGGVGHGLAREDERIRGADAVTFEGGRHVDQRDVRDVLRAGIGDGPGDGAVERAEDHLGGGVGAARVGLEAGAHEVRVEVGGRACRRRSARGSEWAGSSRARRWCRRRAPCPRWRWPGWCARRASFAASPGVTAPFCTQRVPRPMPTPSTSASW